MYSIESILAIVIRNIREKNACTLYLEIWQ
jgi:hypothetical protein